MYRTFNMGVGMVLVVAPEESGRVTEALVSAGEEAWVMGTVQECPDGEEPVRLV
jgi:phosphoribosylformylglycinamidine cyclo-ligase